MPYQHPQKKVSDELYQAILDMRGVLERDYGLNVSFEVKGLGFLLAKQTEQGLRIGPETKSTPIDYSGEL